MKNSNDKPQTFRDKLYASARCECRADIDELVKDSVRSSAKIEGIHRSRGSLRARSSRQLDRTPRKHR